MFISMKILILFFLVLNAKHNPSVSQQATQQGFTCSTESYSARNPDKTAEQARRETFMYWPHQRLIEIDLLVDAGFFFTGS